MRTEVIAEIGVNHQNDIETAGLLIRRSIAAGATAVKFQASTVTEEISLKAAPEHFVEIGKVVPDWQFLRDCAALAERYGVEFLCTPSGVDSLRFVAEDLKCKRLKIASDNLNNVEFLHAAAEAYEGRAVLLSTGMGTIPEIRTAMNILGLRHCTVTVMHCVSAYPCPLDQANLLAVRQMRRFFGLVGYSDHTTSEIVPAMAVTLGASVIEKHITLDRNATGPDHAASLEPDGFHRMVRNIRETEVATGGQGNKLPQPIERDGQRRYRKSLVARQPIRAGEPFTPANLTAKRPGTGVPASGWSAALGKPAGRDYAEDELIDRL